MRTSRTEIKLPVRLIMLQLSWRRFSKYNVMAVMTAYGDKKPDFTQALSKGVITPPPNPSTVVHIREFKVVATVRYGKHQRNRFTH